jgi:hypothetical protein
VRQAGREAPEYPNANSQVKPDYYILNLNGPAKELLVNESKNGKETKVSVVSRELIQLLHSTHFSR